MRFAATRGSVQIAYDLLGTGAPIAMLHEFGESSGFWHECGYVEACLAHGRQIVVVDLRGHGDSGKPRASTAYGVAQLARDVVAVLDHAGIERADFLGYGMGGRLALCMAALAPARTHAVAAGGAHPFAESKRACREALAKGLEAWIDLVEARSGGLSEPRRTRLRSNDRAALAAAAEHDPADMAEAVARSGVPLLMFLGKEDPRYPLALSFAEESGAKVIGLPGHGHSSAVAAARSEPLAMILEFLDQPERCVPAERPRAGLWSGCWT